MIQLFNHHSRAICLVCIGSFCIVASAFSQTTYIIERTLNVKQAYGFTNDFGIKASAAGGKVEVRMYAKDFYATGGREDKNALLYGTYTNSNSSTNYIVNAWDIPYSNNLCEISILGNFACSLNGIPYSKKSTDYKDRVIQVSKKLANAELINPGQLQDPFLIYIDAQQFQVIIELEVNSTTTLNDVTSVKLPGVGEILGKDFRDLPPGHACIGKTTAECDALKELRTGDKNQVIVTAHRGYWGYGNLAEVSMNALRNGYNDKYISIEIDVQQSKDGELLLLHDQRVNRMISFIGTQGQEYPTYDTGNQSDPTIQAAWIQNLNYNTTTPNIPKAGGGTWATYPALKNGRMIDRRGNPTTDPVARFDDALNYIQNEAPGDKPILLSLDIKEKEEPRYLETLSKCLAKAKQYNCLHKIIFKPGSTVNVSAETLRTYLSDPSRNQWNDFAYKSNVILIIVKNTSQSNPGNYLPPDRAFVDGWINLVPSLVCVEYIYKYNDPTVDVLLKSVPAFGNKSVIAYTKERGIRTGAFWEIATDARGVPSGTTNAWYSKTAPDADGATVIGVDARNNPEFTIAPPSFNSDPTANYPGVIVTDRPDIVQKILELHGRYNTKTKRP